MPSANGQGDKEGGATSDVRLNEKPTKLAERCKVKGKNIILNGYLSLLTSNIEKYEYDFPQHHSRLLEV